MQFFPFGHRACTRATAQSAGDHQQLCPIPSRAATPTPISCVAPPACRPHFFDLPAIQQDHAITPFQRVDQFLDRMKSVAIPNGIVSAFSSFPWTLRTVPIGIIG
jgi:hypothetical protein